MRLQSALDNEVHIAVQRFLETGVSADVPSLYTAIQRSNSSLKRRPKATLQASVQRVLDFIGVQVNDQDSEAELEQISTQSAQVSDIMNRSLRATLAPVTALDPPPSPPVTGEDAPRRRRLRNGEPHPKKSKTEGPSLEPPVGLSWDHIGGMDDVVYRLKELVARPLLLPETYAEMKVKKPKGVLLRGPPGCGKTLMARTCAAEIGVSFVEILGPSIVSGMSGESEKALREKFEEARKCAPCLMFLDEIDAIAPKRETSQSQMEKRIVAQLLVCLDELEKDPLKPVMVLAATNRPDSIDAALRRGGRFGSEIDIGVPNEQMREQILKAQTREAPVADDVDFKRLAKMTAGFVGADLQELVGEAGSWQLTKYFDAFEAQIESHNDSMDVDTKPSEPGTTSFRRLVARTKRHDLPQPTGFEDKRISMEAFISVLPHITPSSKREGFATIPDVSWEDIGALKSVREELQTAVVEPIKNPDLYASVGISAPTGVLLWGPPGCGKTLLAKAAAAESKANFISVKGPELLNKFVGESEAAVRRVFTRARSSVPCVIFFDELDALTPRRDDSASEASARVVNTLLTELDGLNERAGIYVIAATNRPDIIDEAMLRPGRLETPLYVDLPGQQERAEIMRTLLRHRKLENISEIAEIAGGCAGYSGADLGALVREAGHCAIRRKSSNVEAQDFRLATQSISGSVRDLQKYEALKRKFGRR